MEESKRIYKKEEKDLVSLKNDLFNKSQKGSPVEDNMDLSKYSDAQIEAIGKQDFCSRVKSSMSTFKDAFSNCNQEISSKHLNVKAELDVNKVAKDYVSKIAKPESAKAELEKVGYTCTIQR